MPVDPQTEAAILSVVQNLFRAYGRFDIKAVLDQFASDADIIRLGGDVRRIGREQLAQQLELDFYFYRQMQRCAWDATWYHLVASGDLACLTMELTATFQSREESVKVPLHMSATFVREKNGWRIAHLHTSPTGRSETARAQLAQILNAKSPSPQPAPSTPPAASSPGNWEEWFEKRSLNDGPAAVEESAPMPAPTRVSEPAAPPPPKGAPASWEEWFERTSFS